MSYVIHGDCYVDMFEQLMGKFREVKKRCEERVPEITSFSSFQHSNKVMVLSHSLWARHYITCAIQMIVS
jgi:hypothetical protein